MEHQTPGARHAVRGPLARGIGVLSVILAACGSTFGQFMVQPMRIDLPTYPGTRTATTFALENQNPEAEVTVDLRLVDMTQDSTGMWQTIEPDAEVVADPNGARWVDFGTESQPLRVDIAKLRSCLGWLRMDEAVVTLNPVHRKVINLWVEVPAGVQGYFCAALTAQTQLTPDDDTGMRAPVFLQFIVPILINVQGRTMRDDIKLIDANLMYREAADVRPAATLVSLGVNNDGLTYARLIGRTRIYGEVGGHWQRITELDYPETSILPGVKINLQQDIGRQLPTGKYRVVGAVYINGRRGDTIDKEILFEGNDRPGGKIAVDAALNLDPRELVIDTLPGATRTTILKVSNASEDPVTVDAALLLPDHMTTGVWSDGQGNSLLGEDFGCVEWVTVEPMRFTLRGYGSQNLKIVAKMPTLPNPLPNYYAMVKLHATYEDAQTAGAAQGLIYVNTKGAQSAPRVAGTKLTLAPSTPSRYIVTASFSNVGNTHVLPRCRVLLTEVAEGIAGAMLRDVPMTSEIFEQGGNLLPLESRQFTGVLDVASVPDGTYYVTAVLQYGPGAAAQRQAAIRIKEEGGAKSVEVISLDAVGGPTQIQL